MVSTFETCSSYGGSRRSFCRASCDDDPTRSKKTWCYSCQGQRCVFEGLICLIASLAIVFFFFSVQKGCSYFSRMFSRGCSSRKFIEFDPYGWSQSFQYAACWCRVELILLSYRDRLENMIRILSSTLKVMRDHRTDRLGQSKYPQVYVSWSLSHHYHYHYHFLILAVKPIGMNHLTCSLNWVQASSLGSNIFVWTNKHARITCNHHFWCFKYAQHLLEVQSTCTHCLIHLNKS